jgi:hypothetical protein
LLVQREDNFSLHFWYEYNAVFFFALFEMPQERYCIVWVKRTLLLFIKKYDANHEMLSPHEQTKTE